MSAIFPVKRFDLNDLQVKIRTGGASAVTLATALAVPGIGGPIDA